MIGVFDSGIGGSTILKEIIKVLPNENYIYYSDSIHNPYGDKSEEELYEIVNNVVEHLISKGCVAIVIACNTASAICVSKLRSAYPNIIFIATEPAYKMVYDHNFDGKTLVLATKRTIESKKFLSIYHKYNNNHTILLPCSGLAELIENEDYKSIDEYLDKHLSNIIDIKNVVLGCTHYPLIKKNITKILGKVRFFDSGRGVAFELKRKLESKNLVQNKEFSITFIDSSHSALKEARFKKILSL